MCGELAGWTRSREAYDRFIPACAGNSGFRRSRRRRPAVHPRVCGELAVAFDSMGCTCGSSPRVRGTRERTAADGDSRVGSSPRVRGTRPLINHVQLLARFIPACAGNSPVWGKVRHGGGRFIPACAGNSPRRGCGERRGRGSSPRVRGTRLADAGAGEHDRFIPACAGNSIVTSARCQVVLVHPRVCGELREDDVVGAEVAGSSPRVRGTPAGTGGSALAAAVHPRVCGELREAGGVGHGPVRFIPACAGNSRPRDVPSWAMTGSSPRVRGTP